MKVEIKKNLKHGYIFLLSTLLVLVAIPLTVELYLTGGFQFTHALESPVEESEPQSGQHSGEVKLEIQNLQNGFKTQNENISIIGISESEAEVKINDKELKADLEGRFEQKIDLAIGTNLISIAANKDGKQSEIKLEIIREAKEEPKVEPQETPQPSNQSPQQPSRPKPAPNPSPQPQPPAPPNPAPPPTSSLTGLKMSCSISNTQPFVGNTVSVKCTLRDQNNTPVSGGFGYVTVNWQSGSSVYTMSQSNSAGAMSVSFQVPGGNSGQISGLVRASKSGLNVSSNFAINVN